MIEAGLVDEVKSLLAEDKPLSMQARCAIGYAEIIDYLNGKTTLDDAVELIKKNSRRFAKSQRTWFKTFREVHWLDISPDPDKSGAEKILERTKSLIANG
jgi:tRNA dimethylallyltransferase